MDQSKCKFILLSIAIILLISMERKAYSDELQKPLIKLPQVNITGQKDIDDPFEDNGIISAEMVAESTLEETPKDETQGFISSSYGSFDTKLFEVEHAMKADTFYYNAYFEFEKSAGDRENSQYTSYQPKLIAGIPFYEENELTVNLDYFDKTMGLPGKTDMLILNAERRNTDTLSSYSLIHKEADVSLKIEPYYGVSLFDDYLTREDFKNKVVGLKFESTNEVLKLDVDAYQNSLINHYEYAICRADLRTASIDVADRWQAIAGINVFAQEKFGQRPAPFIELVFEENDDCLHKFTLTREFYPVRFNETYLDDNYMEVNPQVMRPVRSSEISYNLDKHISSQWRANVLVHYSEDKDYWFLADSDNDGFYAPVSMQQVNLSGIKVSTEYNWSEEFNYFLSLNVRKIRSKDSDYEFVPFEPKQKISVGLVYQMNENAKIDFVGDYFGRRYYSGSSKQSSSAYFILGSKLTYNLKDYLTFFVLVDNLLNDHYDIVKGYPNQSRSILSGVTVRF